jgi:hypothetical protein
LENTGILRSPSEAWNHKFNLIGVSLTKPFLEMNWRQNMLRATITSAFRAADFYVCRAGMTFALVKKAREKRNHHAAEEKSTETQ